MTRKEKTGYFADAQYDGVFLFYVILNDSEESHRRTDKYIVRTFSVGYFAALNMM